MSSQHPPAAEPLPPDGGVPPLTLSTKGGTRHTRHADVEDEIRRALAADPSTWAKTCLQDEALVHLIRAVRSRDDMMDVLGGLVERLGRRVAAIAGRFSKGFSASVREEIADEVGSKVIELVLVEAPTRKSEFLEVGFQRVVKGLTLNVVERRGREPRPHQFAPLVDDADSHDQAGADQSAAVADDGPGPEELASLAETRERIRSSLDAVSDPRHREAVVLHHLRGWPITDQDTTTPTLCAHFNVSDRQIRTWVRRAMDEMREAIGEKP